jgi:hypothetical protein
MTANHVEVKAGSYNHSEGHFALVILVVLKLATSDSGILQDHLVSALFPPIS